MKCYKCKATLDTSELCPNCGMCFKEESLFFLFPLEKEEIEQINAFYKVGTAEKDLKEGIRYLKAGDSERAKKYFRKAAKAGNAEGRHPKRLFSWKRRSL